ncbi:MAG: penicillin-binding protein 2 [Elusimicrobiota bacterium]|jgi:penicillin-binding protein 2|nr:penicillin-binding protein 2 [Elusimicrobiota bacterium]
MKKTKQFFNPKRLSRLLIATYIVAIIIGLRLIDIQFISHRKYTEAAEQNRTQIIYQTAPRGRILTEDGKVLAGNQAAFSLYYIPAAEPTAQEYLNTLSGDIAKYLDAPQAEILAKLKSAIKSGKATMLAGNISPKKIFSFAELQVYYSGLYVVEETKRYYPNGAFLAHLLGYMGTMDNAFWRKKGNTLDYRLNSKIGKSGIEKHFEKELKGRDGGLILEVDYMGRVKQKISDAKWRAGADIFTTINYDVQKAAEDGIKKSLTGRGAVVALNPRNGAVLAMVSSPDFDPNIFSPYSDYALALPKKIPEYNLAIQGLYPPASTFKVITALAAYETGRLNPREETTCNGKIYMNGREFKCWHRHGEHIDFMEGMAQSCDVYFYELGIKAGASHIEKMQRLFRFGRQTGIDLPGEKSGNIYGPSKRARNKTYWFGGDTLNLSIGQGELLLTPIQMANFAATLANKGKIWRPYYIDHITDYAGKNIFTEQPKLVAEVKLKPGAFELVNAALKGVVDNATGRGAKVNGIDVYGKTGTAQNPHGDDHGWFMAFAARPGQEPDLALAVFVEFGKGGAGAAAPIAREIIKAYYGLNKGKKNGN